MRVDPPRHHRQPPQIVVRFRFAQTNRHNPSTLDDDLLIFQHPALAVEKHTRLQNNPVLRKSNKGKKKNDKKTHGRIV
jgi:hypothetical protein